MRSPSYDLLIHGVTAGGIVAAVRAAREGLDVILISESRHLGGSFPSLGAIETHYRGVRAPLLAEFAARIEGHYRASYGADSAPYRACVGGMMTTFEPHVASRILADWIRAEPRITWQPRWVPLRSVNDERHVREVLFVDQGGEVRSVRAKAFMEAGDEGDLMAAIGVPFRVGRESREEFGEPSAGRVFTRWQTGVFPRAAAEGRLNLVTARGNTSAPIEGSDGRGDDNIQSYSYRICLTDDPKNREVPDDPPAGYDRERYAPILLSPSEKERLSLPFHHRFLVYDLREMAERDHLFHGHALPNRKRSWNATNLTGGGKAYPSASGAERRELERKHREHALGLMYFLQNDAAVPEDLRAKAREWGLARDEFQDTGNFPPQLYVREARRLKGRATFTENDARNDSPVGGSAVDGRERRAPLHREAIAITEFSLDSLACTTERLPGRGALCDGQLFQMEVSRPGQIPFGALLPPEIDNFLVVTTMSATHVGWGTVRQTPTQMHVAESAAWAVVLGQRSGVAPANLGVDFLQRHLVRHGISLTFFNECDAASSAPWAPALQYFGARGFFPDYDARPQAPLDAATRDDWSRRARELGGELSAEGGDRATALLRLFEQLEGKSAG